ncbi:MULTISPECIES: hypothetical protein [Actinosynnema]|uniref:hypothetical protein n=1 Tax=Actinosynnema TaxID=40566 RepID=UPI0020A2C89A|nr:hypothetical protein [Actinosynnema pretiosum]MCP2098201.1 hypothetical protein [Actinosynnema pretiosum]
MGEQEMRRFVLEGLAEDERRAEQGKVPLLVEAEQQGRLSLLRTDDGRGLLLTGGGVAATEDEALVPFQRKAELLREEVERLADEPTLRLLATVYEARVGWQEEWRTRV